MSLATVSQNTNTGHWMVKYGEQIADMGKTAESAHNAHWLAVTMNHPDLSDLVTRLLQQRPLKGLEKRAQKAAILAAGGHVSAVKDRPDGDIKTKGAVTSQTDPAKRYFIILEDGRLQCSCPDHNSQYVPVTETGQRLCKHILAFTMTAHLLARRKPGPAVVNFRTQHFRVDEFEPRTLQDPPQYANGDAVDTEDLTEFRIFVDAMRTAPFNREKLIGWIMSG